jgi:hypothetical protein
LALLEEKHESSTGSDWIGVIEPSVLVKVLSRIAVPGSVVAGCRWRVVWDAVTSMIKERNPMALPILTPVQRQAALAKASQAPV